MEFVELLNFLLVDADVDTIYIIGRRGKSFAMQLHVDVDLSPTISNEIYSL